MSLSFLITLIAGIVFLVFLFFIPPHFFAAPVVFLFLTFLLVFFLFSAVLRASRRGFIVALGVLTYMILSYLGVSNWLNSLLILGTVFTLQWYFWNK